MRCCYSSVNQHQPVKIQNQQLHEVNRFKYLGSVVINDGMIYADVTHRINTGRIKQRKLLGVQDSSPTSLINRTECWPMKKTHTTKVHTTEMKIQRWTGGVTLADRVRNEYICKSFKIRPIGDKLSEARLMCSCNENT